MTTGVVVVLREVGCAGFAQARLWARGAEIAPEAVGKRDNEEGKFRMSARESCQDALQNPPRPEPSEEGQSQ